MTSVVETTVLPMRDPYTGEMIPVGTRVVFPNQENRDIFIPETAGKRFADAISQARKSQFSKTIEDLEKAMKHEEKRKSFFGRLFHRRATNAAPAPETAEEKLNAAAKEQELLVKKIELEKIELDMAKGPAKKIHEIKLRNLLEYLKLLNVEIKTIGESMIVDTTIAGTQSINNARSVLTIQSQRAASLAYQTDQILINLGTVVTSRSRLGKAVFDPEGLAVGEESPSLDDEWVAAGLEKDETVDSTEIDRSPGEDSAPERVAGGSSRTIPRIAPETCA